MTNKSDVNWLGNVYSDRFTGGTYGGNVYGTDALCPAMGTMQGGGGDSLTSARWLL